MRKWHVQGVDAARPNRTVEADSIEVAPSGALIFRTNSDTHREYRCEPSDIIAPGCWVHVKELK